MGNNCCLSNRQKKISGNEQINQTFQKQKKNLENSQLVIQIQQWASGIYKTFDSQTISCNAHVFDSCFIAKPNLQNLQKVEQLQHFTNKNLDYYDFVLSINKNIRQFQINNIGLDYSIWEKKYNYFQIKVGDVLRIGKGEFQLKNVILNQKDFQKPLIPLKKNKKKFDHKSNISSIPQCRICLQKQINSSDPLLVSCQCTGSLEFIHLQCMKNWLQVTSIHNKRLQNSLIVNLSKNQCQICQKSIISSTGFQQLMYSLILNQKDLKPPMVLLEGTLVLQNRAYKSYYFYSFAKKNQLQIGRSQSLNQMCIEKDKTVSKTHALIFYKENSKMIAACDLGSTFGTYKKIKKGINLNQGDEKQLMIKCNIVKLKVQQVFNPEQLVLQIKASDKTGIKKDTLSFDRQNKMQKQIF